MSKSVSNSLILLFASIGCFITLVLFYEHLRPSANIGCSAVGGDCSAANESSYGHVGPVPTSIFGLAMYATVVGVCLKRKKLFAENQRPYFVDPIEPKIDPEPDDSADIDIGTSVIASPGTIIDNDPPPPNRRQLRALDLAVWLIAAPAVGISWWLQDIALYRIYSFCPWCMSSAFLVTFIFLLASKDLFLDNRKLEGEQKLLVGTVTLMAALGLLMMMPDIMHQINVVRGRIATEKNGWITVKATLPPIQTVDMESSGPKDAPFKIVEFADYQCPHCAKASAMMREELAKENPKRYHFAFRNYPLPIYITGRSPAALAAEAAGLQGKFWEMHDLIFAHQDDMDKKVFNMDAFSKYAEQLGLSMSRFEKDEGSDKLMSKVAQDSTTARLQGVMMTPTFFIINRKGGVYQLTGLEKMKEAMDDPGHKAWH